MNIQRERQPAGVNSISFALRLDWRSLSQARSLSRYGLNRQMQS